MSPQELLKEHPLKTAIGQRRSTGHRRKVRASDGSVAAAAVTVSAPHDEPSVVASKAFAPGQLPPLNSIQLELPWDLHRYASRIALRTPASAPMRMFAGAQP